MGVALTNEKELVCLAAQWEHWRRQLSEAQAEINRQLQQARDQQSTLENEAALEHADFLWLKEQEARAAFEAFLQAWYTPAKARSALRQRGPRDTTPRNAGPEQLHKS